MKIRLAEANDLEALYALGQGVGEFEVSADTVEFWPKAILTKAIDSADVAIVVAEDAGELVGFTIANVNATLQKAIIENLFVSPAYRGKGMGGELVRYLCDVLTTTYRCSYIVSLVPPDAMGALQTYQQAGFAKGNTFVWLDASFSDEFKR